MKSIHNSQKILIFTDGSVDPKSKVGYGAYIITDNTDINSQNVKTKRFEDTSSTKLELQILLYVLSIIKTTKNITIYTDSQNIVGLQNRRQRFEQNEYYTKAKKLIANHSLYKEFFEFCDVKEFEVIKVIGHQKESLKSDIDKVFSLVDNASRDKLREKDNN
ncbi:MAG: Unknown protein [uncultured Campylobacterales bacterium]|uniref:RNase H type-1 domain-containing protein n=1 Tax=uncultured Campylobacterales bacterium TaxID=352960 RepID=A0A6S6T6W0_9BACT|nr:MAG: Unknown protein [uncultured Campylobacterales bacterium]